MKYYFIKEYGDYKVGDMIELDLSKTEDNERYHDFVHKLIMHKIMAREDKKLSIENKEINKELDIDFNKDGKINKEDISLAGKILRSSRKKVR